MKFISKEECEILGLGEKEELLNEILSRVYNGAIEGSIKKLPEVISRLMVSTAATQKMTKQFFADNEEFEDHKEIVAAVVQDIDSLHPDWNYGDIMEEAKPIIKEKIAAIKNKSDLQLGLPDEVNLKGNGVI